ncbi:MAG: cation-transporting P-type ATPase [Burkholderiaceae bacterium]|nr:cation-transporting P-type ATPase [Burkholderiaceae bacterium]
MTSGPLGPRFRVRGLRGCPGLAEWLAASTTLPRGARLLASSETGIVRVDLRDAHAARREAKQALVGSLAAALESARHSFDAVRVPRASAMRRTRPVVSAPREPDESRSRTGPALEAARPTAVLPASAAPSVASGTPARGVASDHHAVSLRNLLSRLASSAQGLSADEAQARLQRDGPNEIRDITARSDLEILAAQFKSVPVALLAGSGGVALVARDFGDAAAIGAVLAANGGIGYVTERRAEQTVSALRKLAPRAATVLRDCVETTVPAREVVVGDILVLKPGEPVAADARVIESHRLSANEAPLTGESLPVRKEPGERVARDASLGERSNMLHMGTVISGGTGRALVVAIGEHTVLGSIRALAQTSEAPRTRMQSELDGLGKRLAVGAAALCGGLFMVGLLRGRPLLPLVRTAVSLGVAAIPEGLPTVATSLLAAGIRTLQKRNVYARRLDAIENLGAVDVVGFDKTGTLTQNRMSVAEVLVGGRHVSIAEPDSGDLRLPADWLLVCALCNDLTPAENANAASPWQGSSTEIALLDFAARHGARVEALRAKHRRLAVKQRSEHHPYMVTLHADDRAHALVAVKGRPAEVLARCTAWFDGRRTVALSAAQRRRLLAANDAMATRGQRVLALAITRQRGRTLGTTEGLTWLGLIGLSDPIRPGIGESIARFRAAGIRPLMLTGDQIGTATAVAEQIGLDGERQIADAGALPEDASQLSEVVEHAGGFARSSPAMKLAIIRALQARGHVVAMTGDGINDGPALKTADVGVAMGASGTDFAQAMSDLVLQDDHPDGLLAAIAEGRTSYLNVKKAVRYLVATNVSELALMGSAMIAGLPDPLDPLALLWTNLITDVSPAIALGLEPPEPDILQRPPFPRSAALLDARDWRTVAADGGMITAAALASFLYGIGRYGPTPRAKTIAFMTLTSAQLLYALSARSETPLVVFGKGRLRRNPWLSRTVVLSLGAQAATVLFPPLRALLRTTPIGLVDAAVIAACAAAPTLGREAIKRLRRAPAGTTRRAMQAPPRRR